jgi:O-methyltransferase
VSPFTMTSPERVFALRQSVHHIIRNKIPGDIVECGVWKGGSMMVIARTLLELGVTDRNLRLFDTFQGMSEPTTFDSSRDGEAASDLLATSDKETSWVWAYSPVEEVRRNVKGTGYPAERLEFVQGKVEDTLPANAPTQIALLRLDTDWYESTYHELVHLYPRLSAGGILIIDDYGHWEGARKAVDQYFEEQGLKPLLHRIDYTGRICIKANKEN